MTMFNRKGTLHNLLVQSSGRARARRHQVLDHSDQALWQLESAPPSAPSPGTAEDAISDGNAAPSQGQWAAIGSPLGPADWVSRQTRANSTSLSGPYQTLVLVQELDLATAVFGRLQLRRALETGRGPLVIDCSAVRFIDATWLGVLLSTARYGAQLGRKVTVSRPRPRILRVLRLVGLDWLMEEE